jgi:hypothetical protein
MSIPVLTQVYDEVRRLSIAGSVVAAGDFRLKKLVGPLEQAGHKAPVFAKVAQAVTKLIDSTEKTSAEVLLDLSTLINAILYTQGETGRAGELAAIETTDLGQQATQASARVLKPLLEALSTTGSGRLEIIKEAHERGAFRDLRLVKPALTAIDDSYPEIGEFVAENVLPLYGKAILPELRAKFDIKGRGGHVRRLQLMHQLDPEGSREAVKQALEEGSKEVKVAAIECLGDSPDDLSFLLEQAKAKAKDVREAALKALGKSDSGDAIAVLQKSLESGDIDLAVEPVRKSPNPKLLEFVHEQVRSQLQRLLAGKEKDKKVVGKHASHLLSLLECLRGKDDKATAELLVWAFGQRDKLGAIKSEPGGKDIEQRLVALMAEGPTKAQAALVDAHATLDAGELELAMLAACRSRKPADVFAMFSTYLTAKLDSKKDKRRDPTFAKRQAISEVLVRRWRHYNPVAADGGEKLIEQLDPRWLDLAVAQSRQEGTLTLARPGSAPGHLEIVMSLARSGHSAANKLLAEAFDDRFKKSKDLWECGQVLETMVRVQHPAATEAMIATIEKHAKGNQGYGLYWIGRLIPQLPQEAAVKLEALLPTLPEKVIDQLLDYVTQLKNRP